MDKQKGLTLIELMVVVAILGIGITISLPSWTLVIAENRMAGDVNRINGAIALARSYAVTEQTAVSLCTAVEGEGEDAGTFSCTASLGNKLHVLEGDQLLRVVELSGANSLTGASQLAFDGNGFLASTVTMDLINSHHQDTGNTCYSLNVNITGLTSIDKNSIGEGGTCP